MSIRPAVAALCCALALFAPASARTVQVRWKAGSAGVAGYKIYTRFTDKPYAEGKDVGLPTPEDGVYTGLRLAACDRRQGAAPSGVGDGRTGRNGAEEGRSNEKRRVIEGSRPGERP